MVHTAFSISMKGSDSVRIEAFDTHFTLTVPDEAQMTYYDVLEAPFSIHGMLHDKEGYYRLPPDIAARANEGVASLSLHTAGGRVRFLTDADRIALRAEMRDVSKMPHFAFTGSAGFDLYANNVYRGTFVPPLEIETGYSAEMMIGTDGLREITIHFPLYSGVKKLEIGLPSGSKLGNAGQYRTADPVVYYGSSITQGGCASRPGNAYPNILSRLLSCDHLNLGFSGSARGESCMAEYIAGLTMSAFVLDYDHNAPDPAHLEATHSAFFRIIRERNPILPVFLLSRPQPNPNKDDLVRREIVRKTWKNATQTGDRNVYFIDGTKMLSLFGGDGGTVDNCHPNDMGFYCMAKTLEPALRHVLLGNQS